MDSRLIEEHSAEFRIPELNTAFHITMVSDDSFAVNCADLLDSFPGFFSGEWKYEPESAVLYFQSRNNSSTAVWALPLLRDSQQYCKSINDMMKAILASEMNLDFCIDQNQIVFYYYGNWYPIKEIRVSDDAYWLSGFGLDQPIKILRKLKETEELIVRPYAEHLSTTSSKSKSTQTRKSKHQSGMKPLYMPKTANFIQMPAPRAVKEPSDAQTCISSPDTKHVGIPDAQVSSAKTNQGWKTLLPIRKEYFEEVPGVVNNIHRVARHTFVSVSSTKDHNLYMINEDSEESKHWNRIMQIPRNGTIKFFATRHFLEVVIPDLNLKLKSNSVMTQEDALIFIVDSVHNYSSYIPGSDLPVTLKSALTGLLTFRYSMQENTISLYESKQLLYQYDVAEQHVTYNKNYDIGGRIYES